MSSQYAGSRSALVDEYLKRHYPCAELPTGTLSEVARRFGVSRELVRQRAGALGMITRLKGAPVCSECGGPITPGYRRCQVCVSNQAPLHLTCDGCGSTFTRKLSEVKATSPERGYSNQKAYCSHTCYLSFMAGRTLRKRQDTPQ